MEISIQMAGRGGKAETEKLQETEILSASVISLYVVFGKEPIEEIGNESSVRSAVLRA